MTPERLESQRGDYKSGLAFGSVYLKWLFAHIDTQAARIVELERKIDRLRAPVEDAGVGRPEAFARVVLQVTP